MVAGVGVGDGIKQNKVKKLTITCFYCQKPGHKISECYSRKAAKAQKAANPATTSVPAPAFASTVNAASMVNATCGYCHKNGHKTVDCRKLKKAEKEKKTALIALAGNASASGTESTVGHAFIANASTEVCESNIPLHSQWKIDTGATAHMCDNLAEFRDFSESDDTVIVGGNIPLQVKG